MAKNQEIAETRQPFFAQPFVGTVFAIVSSLSFYFLCMILPLVGKAGSVTTYARENATAFLAVLILSLVTGVLATFSKFERRKIDGSAKPVFSLILTGLCILLLVAFFLGLLKI